jgi:hypothetical protein
MQIEPIDDTLKARQPRHIARGERQARLLAVGGYGLLALLWALGQFVQGRWN